MHREVLVLAALVVVTVAAFFLTRRVASANEALRLADAREWYVRGRAAVQKGDLDAALPALRRAAARNPDGATYVQALAAALTRTHQEDAALALLLDLRERQPDDAETNLQLARLEAGGADLESVSRLYQIAIIGFWKPDERQSQRLARTEFIQFLLSRGERDRALSELIVLETGLPDDVPSQLGVGQMLLDAGSPRRAADHFSKVLRVEATSTPGIAGAAEASFELGDYAAAERYLARLSGDSGRIGELRILTDLVLGHDPLAARLTLAERRRRLDLGLAQIVHRLETCEPREDRANKESKADVQSRLADVRAYADGSRRSAPRSTEWVEAGFEAVYRAELAADGACAAPGPLDRALVLIGRRHALEAP